MAAPDKQKARSRAYYLAHREEVKARNKAWAAANRERTREIVRAYEAAHVDERKASHHAAYLAKTEQVKADSRRRRQANPEKFREYQKRYYSKHREQALWRARTRLIGRYGLTVAEYDSLLAAQGHSCRICGTITPGQRSWHIDHDHSCCPGSHSCGRCVRGLLCHNCNCLLGHAGDNPDVLRRAIEYLSAPRLRAVK